MSARHSVPHIPPDAPKRGRARRRGTAVLLSGALGVAAALLVSCGSSAKLIPVANSEPLQADFEEVAHAAEAAHGDCGATEAALRKTEHDLATLPSSVDAGLRRRLGEGLNRLRTDALELCATPSTQTTQTTTSSTPTTQTNTTPSTQTNTQTTSTETTPPGGGTPAEEEEKGPGDKGKHDHKGNEAPPPAGGAAGGAAAEGGAK